MTSWLIKNAELPSGQCRDVTIKNGRIHAIAERLQATPADQEIDANGGALLPGLNDHHLHLAALATARSSVACGPPDIKNSVQLSQLLQARTTALADTAWLRGVGYHESVAGDIDAAWLDARASRCPIRIQHRGGRLWVFNSRALELLAPQAGDPFERVGGRLTGRLLDADGFLREKLGSVFPDLTSVSRELASYGVTGVTDTTPQNNSEAHAHFLAAMRQGQLQQRLIMMGDASLDSPEIEACNESDLQVGAHKFHLLESNLPDFDSITMAIARSHRVGRAVAFHCVTRTELVFALAALHRAERYSGDRIEHASVTPPELAEQLRYSRITVVTQPGFVARRGDQYLRDVAREDQPWLYRVQGLLQAGVTVAGSSDAPFGLPNPWLGMHAAVTRLTDSGACVGEVEAVSPEQALALYTSPLSAPGKSPPELAEGDVADLCLLSQPWDQARASLSQVRVRLTLRGGSQIYPSPSG